MSTSRTFVFIVFLALFVSVSARAEPQNPYAKRGRTIVSAYASGYRSNANAADLFGHEHTWVGRGRLTMLHFVADYVALGGTFEAGANHLNRSGAARPNYLYYGGDLDLVGQLPVARRLSLRLWLWGGVRWSKVHSVPPEYAGQVDFESPVNERMTVSAGVAPELLLHLTSSVAVTFGPSFMLDYDVDQSSAEFDFRAGPGMTYAFGPDESGQRLEDARNFSGRGRRVLSSGLTFDRNTLATSLAFARFVIPRLAVGGYVSGGTESYRETVPLPDGYNRENHLLASSFGGGAQLLYDVPLPGSISLLTAPRIGYMWKATVNRLRDYRQAAHELQVRVPVYLALHLHEALVIGAGPELALDVRFAEPYSSPEPNARYVRGGVSSTITASF